MVVRYEIDKSRQLPRTSEAAQWLRKVEKAAGILRDLLDNPDDLGSYRVLPVALREITSRDAVPS